MAGEIMDGDADEFIHVETMKVSECPSLSVTLPRVEECSNHVGEAE